MSRAFVFRRWWQRLFEQPASYRKPIRRFRPQIEELEPRIQLSTTDGAFHVVALDAMRADPIYAGITGVGIGVADLDTGIYANNPDLKPNVKGWYDAVVDLDPQNHIGNVADAFDPNGHGSHTAGISASANPAIGVAYQANLYAVRVLPAPDERVSGDPIVRGLQWVYYHADQFNIKVVNMSIQTLRSNVTGAFDPPTEQQRWIKLLQDDRGIAVVICSGNQYANFAAPGVSAISDRGTFTVANTWSQNTQLQQPLFTWGGQGSPYMAVEVDAAIDRMAASSQRSQFPMQVAAPGSNILSTWTNLQPSEIPGDPNHNIEGGTSMACPLVAGMVALMQQTAQQFGHKYLSIGQIQSIVLTTADTIVDSNVSSNGRIKLDANGKQVGGTVDLPETGASYKRVNVYGAMRAVRAFVTQGTGGTVSADTNNTINTSVNLGNLDGTRILSAGGGISTDGQVQTGAADVDLFKINVTSTGVIKPDITPTGTNFFPYLNLFNSNGNLIDDNYNAATNTIDYAHFRINAIQQPGIYYVGVSAFKNNGYNIATGQGAVAGIGTGTYQLKLSLTNPDPNGVLAGAVPDGGLPNSFDGIIGSDPPPLNSSTRITVPGDVDMFQVNAPDDGDLTVIVDGDDPSYPAPFYSAIRIFNPQGQELAKQAGFLVNQLTYTGVKKGQTYFVAVSDYNNASYGATNPYNRNTNTTGGNYHLNLDFDNHDQNGTAMTAVNATVGTPLSSFIGTDPDPNNPGQRIVVGHDGTKDVDFFLYQASSDGYLDVAAAGTNGFVPALSLWKLSADQTSILPIGATTDTNSEIIQPIAAGEYLWVAVTGLGNHNFDWFAPGSGSGGMTGICTVNAILRPLSDAGVLTDNQIVSGGQAAPRVQSISIGGALPANLGVDGNVAVGSADVDLYRFVAPLSVNLTIHTNTSGENDAATFLRFFDAAGNELKYTGDGDPRDTNNDLVVSVLAGQTYYIGVNGAGANARIYNPVTGAGAPSAPNSAGNYVLTLSIAPTPTGTINTDTPTFFWPLVPGATSYYVAWIDTATGQVAGTSQAVTGQYWTLGANQALTPGKVYSWFVGAVIGNSLSWNSGAQLRVAPLTAPVATGPSGTVNAAAGYDKPTFTWNNVPSAAYYYLFVIDQTTGQAVLSNSHVTGNSWKAPTALTPGHQFAWYLGAYSTNGQSAVWNAGQIFRLGSLTAPVANGPSGNIAAANGFDLPNFMWTTSPGAASYYVYVLDTTTGKSAITKPGLTGANWQSTIPLTPGHNFTWYVGAYSTDNMASTWSAGKTFTLARLAAAVGIGPNGAIATDPPTFTWNAAPGAAYYVVYVIDKTTNQAAASSPAVFGTSWTPSAALPRGRNYTWYLAAVSSDNQAVTWNAGMNFNIV